MMKRRTLLTVLWMGAAAYQALGLAAAEGGAPVRLAVDPAQPTIGDLVTVRLVIDDPAFDASRIVGVTFSPDADHWHTVSPWRWNRDHWEAQLRPFDVGALTIPPTTLLWRAEDGSTRETVTTATLTVRSVRPPTGGAGLFSLRGPAEPAPDRRWLWLAGAAALACAVAGWIAAGLRRRRSEPPLPAAEPPLAPGPWAQRELERRAQLPECIAGPPKAVFTHASEVLRLYLGRRFGLRAIDLTTGECLRELERLGVDGEVRAWVGEFLEECDRVKFARAEPPPERLRTIWDDARAIVWRTSPREEFAS